MGPAGVYVSGLACWWKDRFVVQLGGGGLGVVLICVHQRPLLILMLDTRACALLSPQPANKFPIMDRSHSIPGILHLTSLVGSLGRRVYPHLASVPTARLNVPDAIDLGLKFRPIIVAYSGSGPTLNSLHALPKFRPLLLVRMP